MSAAVSSLILEMEKYLKEAELMDSDYIAEWNEKFRVAVKEADRGAGWESIVERAHALNDTIQKRIGDLNFEREQMNRELNIQASGKRALKGYLSGIQ